MAQNRLNLPSMVNRHIGNNTAKPETFFEPLVIPGPSGSQDQEDRHKEKTDIEPSLNSIVAMVHKDLNEVKIAKANRTSPDVTANASTTAQNPVTNPRQISYNAKTSEFFTRRETSVKPDIPNKSIAQIKAKLQGKQQQTLRRGIIPPDHANNFDNQKRLQEVLRQRHILEEILEEHEKIQRDRNSITREIRTMKEYLNEIRCKLDTSLKKLGAQKTIMDQTAKAARASSKRYTKAEGATNRRKTPVRKFVV